MQDKDRDLKAWDAVMNDLRTFADHYRRWASGRAEAALLDTRLAWARLARGLVEDGDALRNAGGAETSPEDLLASLSLLLAGQPAPHAVLDALRPSLRGEALATLRVALKMDGGCRPALRAAVALATVAGQWADAVVWLERLVATASPEEAAAALVQLGDIHWKKLGQPLPARKYYLRARQSGAGVDLLDKLLKLELEMERWDDAVGTCKVIIDLVRQSPEQAALEVTYRLTLGEIHVYGLKRPEIALRQYLRALVEMPNYALTRTLLHELLEANPTAGLQGAWSRLADVDPIREQRPFEWLMAALDAAPRDLDAALAALVARLSEQREPDIDSGSDPEP